MRNYANVVATLALFLSLGGGAYAAVTVTGRNVANGTLTGKDVRNQTIRSADVSGLRISDFAPGQLPAGPKGDKGDRGDAGPPAPSGPGARVRLTARQSFPNGVATVVALNDVEFDSAGAFDDGGDRLVAPREGVYVINALLNWSVGSTANGNRGAWIEVNGVPRGTTRDANALLSASQTVTTVDRLQRGDAVRLKGIQDSGAGMGTVNVTGVGHAYLSFQWLGP